MFVCITVNIFYIVNGSHYKMQGKLNKNTIIISRRGESQNAMLQNKNNFYHYNHSF